MTNKRFLIFSLLAALLLPFAWARVDFGLHEFPVSEFRDAGDIDEMCAAPASSSFWCDRLGETLTRIPTKGADFFFDNGGELVAVFGKHQKGQNLGNYNLDSGQNLIPPDSSIPGGSLLLDGDYLQVEDVEGGWEQVSETEFEGRFTFEANGLQVERVVRVSNITHTLKYAVSAQRGGAEGVGEADAADFGSGEAEAAAAGDAAGAGEAGDGDGAAGGEGTDEAAAQAAGEGQVLQLAFQGIARQDDPIVKIGQGESASVDPIPQPVPDADYVSLQTNNTRGFAIVMRPTGSAEESLLSIQQATGAQVNGAALDLAALALSGDTIAMQRPLEPGDDSAAALAVDVYTGPNELVRYTQEGYADLPGLFDPNILGRLSLGIIWFLRYIHEFVGSWGLSIIVLTLMFRILIWPLISTQTKSMFGMQQLQPKIQALQKKYKDDREKLTQETMKLYREAGVNPAGGCLPILAQMPLFIILWRVFVNFEFNEGFIWIPDLGQSDPFYILPALYVGVMVAMSYFSTRGNKQQFRQQMLINVVFVFILINFPAGVILYFVVSMGVQVLQYWLLSRNKPQAQPAKS